MIHLIGIFLQWLSATTTTTKTTLEYCQYFAWHHEGRWISWLHPQVSSSLNTCQKKQSTMLTSYWMVKRYLSCSLMKITMSTYLTSKKSKKNAIEEVGYALTPKQLFHTLAERGRQGEFSSRMTGCNTKSDWTKYPRFQNRQMTLPIFLKTWISTPPS